MIKIVAKTIVCSGILLLSSQGLGGPFELSYSGRLLDSAGRPSKGPLTLRFEFYRTSEGGTPIDVTIPDFSDVNLSEGVFQVKFPFSEANFHKIFDGNQEVWIATIDVTNQVTYPRQEFLSVPFALKVPVDGSSIKYDSQGKLTLGDADELRIKHSSETHLLKFKTNDGMTEHITLTFPSDDGPPEYYLKKIGRAHV